MSEYTPNEADVRDTYGVGWNAMSRPDALAPHDVFSRWLAAHDAEVRAEERAKIEEMKDYGDRAVHKMNQARSDLRDEREKLQDRIEELEKNLSYEVEQKIKLADTLRDERAKRPDREQVRQLVQQALDPFHVYGAEFSIGDTDEVADAVLSSLALEPEAREASEDDEPDPSLDDCPACDAALSDCAPDAACCEDCSHVHNWPAPEAREEHRPVDIEPSDTVCAKCSRRQGDGTYAETVEWPCASAEAREESELFHDQDGDLWKLTSKGEWFHEEEPGEFRQVLSIDAEDQTLTPVGHAELAPDAEVAREAE